ncbi:GTPase Era [Acetanaerobacterium elongatum]|uniref:GTPase Era n=1 Tax=Acetanaerobacterium elongatum TaxID=258515 RepID=A0A1H0A320_9FIRM|nr:GTPase Era [Acetanaerobacterium elongatum]SDN27787.1 GTP-binding protein Era [Acetanaerobacterium elongatum]
MLKTKSEFVAIVGKPNAGKSSLLNSMIGEKIAIVSNKPQTTRTRITGVLTKESTQFVFIDTPGLHKPKTKLDEYMVKQVDDSVADVDTAVLVVDFQGEPAKAELELIDSFKSLHIPALLVINKIDTLAQKEQIIQRIDQYRSLFEFESVIPLSAKTGEGVEILLKELDKLAQEGPHFFPGDTMTDQPERVIAAEIIREKLLRNLSDEVPHGTAVEIESMKEREGADIIDIDAVIYCEKESHKGIIIGKGGAMLKKVATQARKELEDFLDIKVNLKTWVKVKDDWRNKESAVRSLGYN